MLRVGLTGGLGAGKSTLAGMLAQRGAAVRDADGVVEGLYRAGGAAVPLLVQLFGAEILAPDGAVDRGRLAKLVAANGEALEQLNRVVHPLVRQELSAWLEELERLSCPPTVAVVEAALLVETGSFRRFHRLVVVTAPEPLRRKRALASGMGLQAVERLLQAQAREEEKCRLAHYVVDNSATLEALAARAKTLWEYLLQDAERLAAGKPLPQGPTLFL
ncbi:MAG: dephospho-CoA kinase [Thermoanaerobaculum sp.]|nr:dephospho-CoA kinase [Thermoanaerobaculum sp.]MDW7967482.1 dephospho-CoA kinase [Thermoanaerobaculum sp.]